MDSTLRHRLLIWFGFLPPEPLQPGHRLSAKFKSFEELRADLRAMHERTWMLALSGTPRG